MTTDFRALCAELVQAFEDLRNSSHGVFGLHLNGDLAPWDELIEGGRFEDWLEVFARARAALADEPASVVGEPSDEEIIAFWSDHCAGDGDAGIIRLARWGNPAPQPPAEGEVAELVDEARYLVRELRDQADDLNPCLELFGLMHQAAVNLARAADLLQRLSPLQPLAEGEPNDEELLRAAAFAIEPHDIRWSTPEPPLPADKEAAELVEWLMITAGGEGSFGRVRSICAAELLQREALVPVAWMYKGESDFDGKKWRENWLVTLDQRLAEHGAKPDKPIPLFRAQIAPTPMPLPGQEVSNG